MISVADGSADSMTVHVSSGLTLDGFGDERFVPQETTGNIFKAAYKMSPNKYDKLHRRSAWERRSTMPA
jgi:hypothetical protein